MNESVKQVSTFVEKESSFVSTLFSEIGKIIVGQKYVVERLLIGVLTGGHLLLEGVPGLAKTLSVKTLAEAVNVSFRRIQFTPDLLPADLIGTLIFNQAKGEFSPRLGPIFSNFVLADEINRAPAKVQSALLESMQEKQVTIGDTTYELPTPFLVLATQNPIEQEGTYPLPEAQVDRFLMKLKVGYPTKEEEMQILERGTQGPILPVQKVISPEDIQRCQQVIEQVYVDERLKKYVLDIVLATREPESVGLADLSAYIDFGASPRATIALIKAAKAHAFLNGRGFVSPEDIKAIVKDVLRHRIIPSFEAEAEELTPDDLIDKIMAEIEVP